MSPKITVLLILPALIGSINAAQNEVHVNNDIPHISDKLSVPHMTVVNKNFNSVQDGPIE